MSWFSALFSADKALENIGDKDNGLLVQAGNWVGGFSYTEEEKAEADADTRAWGLNQLEALAPFKVMQRIMVTIIMVEWAIIINVFLVAICMNATTVITNLYLFVQTPFAWVPVSGAVGLYLMGGVIPSRSKG